MKLEKASKKAIEFACLNFHYSKVCPAQSLGYSVFNNKNTTFISPNQFQIRGMAIVPKFQKRGFGQKLVNHCEEFIQNQKGTLIWFNARENAVSFYEKLHYKKIGDPFAIAEIGLHYLMKKEIDYPYE